MFAYGFALVERVKAELNRLKADRKGITALEYGILAAIVVGALITAATTLGGDLKTLFTNIGNKLVLGS
jgi:pilus assembly protein Flp/PilA